MTEVLTLTMLKQKVRDAVLLPANYWSTGTASACSKVKHNQEQYLYLYLYLRFRFCSARTPADPVVGSNNTRLPWNTRSRLGKNDQQLSMYLYYYGHVCALQQEQTNITVILSLIMHISL